MYLTLIQQRLSTWGRQLWRQMVLRSGVVTIGAVAFVVLGLALGWRAHTRGRFARLKAELKRSDVPQTPQAPRPGGQDAFVLDRLPIEGGRVPEFLSATILPGRGMNVLQITAILPEKGRVNLLSAPSLEEAAKRIDDPKDSGPGGAVRELGSPLEAPWSGDIFGIASADGLNTVWRGMNLHLPAQQHNGVAVASNGLLLTRASTAAKTNIMPDGGEAEAVYDAGDFDGHWPSHMRIRSVVQLSSRAVEMKVTATNTGTDPQPAGLGWRPKFAILNNDRAKTTLRIPSVTREELRASGAPSGHLLSVEGTKYDFSSTQGTALGDLALNDTFVHLRQATLDNGPVVELRDPVNNYGLRITMLSSSIKTVHVEAPADGDFVTVEPRFNYDDPFGHEWSKDEDTGMVVLEPGQSVQWRIRLEIFPLNSVSKDQM